MIYIMKGITEPESSQSKGGAKMDNWEKRVQELEAEGLTRSDAQAVVDVEDNKGGAKMLHFNGKKFAKDDAEFTESLFQKDGTCVGYYKVNKKSITLYDMQKNRIGVICNHVLGKASRLSNGKYWYSYGDIDLIGRYNSYSDLERDIVEAEKLLTS